MEFKAMQRVEEYCNSIKETNPYEDYLNGYNQALEDSKYTELLEMIEELIHQFEYNNNSSQEVDLLNEAKQLIKQATEL